MKFIVFYYCDALTIFFEILTNLFYWYSKSFECLKKKKKRQKDKCGYQVGLCKLPSKVRTKVKIWVNHVASIKHTHQE